MKRHPGHPYLLSPIIVLLWLVGLPPFLQPTRAELPPGRPTFFAGNPVTRHLAFRYQVGLRALGWTDDRTGVYGLFGQSSFWLLDNEDRGYTVESNYEPEVMLFLEGQRLGGWWPESLHPAVSYSHHSNGIDGDLSRSWNHINLGLHWNHPRRNMLSGSLVGWVPFNEEIGNEDIARFAGHGRLSLRLRPAGPVRLLGKVQLDAATCFSFDHPRVLTSLEVSLSFAPGWLERPPFANGHAPLNLFVQWYLGRGESLIEYRDYHNAVRFGLSLL